MSTLMRIRELESRLSHATKQIERLEDEVAFYRASIGCEYLAPPALGLTPSESRLLHMLLSRPVTTREALLLALYGNRPDCDEPNIRVVDVIICNMRKKLKKYSVHLDIKTQSCVGYYMTRPCKDMIRSMENPS